MPQSWYYRHAGQTRGPVSSEEMKALARKGELKPADLVWAEGTDAAYAISAEAAIDFSTLPPPPSPRPGALPDWLADVESMDRTGPLPGPAAAAETPEWVEDMLLWFGAEERPVQQATPPAPKKLTPAAGPAISKSVEKWDVDVLEPAASSAPPVPSSTRSPASYRDNRLDAIPFATPVDPPASEAELRPTTGKAPSPATPAEPLPTPTARATPAPATQRLVNKTLLETGFDPATGRIVDAAKFEKWKHRSASLAGGSSSLTNASLLEIFRKGRLAVEAWVDDERNRSFVMDASIADIHQNAGVIEILSKCSHAGSELQSKLKQHLAFIVENRRKYYRAAAAKLS
jgi:hypothetical protein